MGPFPDGWYAILQSAGLPAGEVVSLARFGRELVAFRGRAGKAAVLDAHCAHAGAHLGRGGCVEDGAVVCAVHRWAFGPDGRCSNFPVKARVRSYPVV
jgi:phenylpropionate dioxygenase-like ring-hydroxylating dioxygenase large terminal subunit